MTYFYKNLWTSSFTFYGINKNKKLNYNFWRGLLLRFTVNGSERCVMFDFWTCFVRKFLSTSFNHIKKHTWKNHSKQYQDSYDDSWCSNEGRAFAYEPRSNFITSFRVDIWEWRIVLARFALNSVDFLTAWKWQFTIPVAECFNTTASQTRLGCVPIQIMARISAGTSPSISKIRTMLMLLDDEFHRAWSMNTFPASWSAELFLWRHSRGYPQLTSWRKSKITR